VVKKVLSVSLYVFHCAASIDLVNGFGYFSIKKENVKQDRLKLPDIDQVSSSGESFPSAYFLAFATFTSLSLAIPNGMLLPSLFGQAPLAIPHAFGVHYPSDVVAGAIIGSGSASYHKVNKWINKKSRNDRK
jgi:membrane-associated phospholipid phosphatase